MIDAPVRDARIRTTTTCESRSMQHAGAARNLRAMAAVCVTALGLTLGLPAAAASALTATTPATPAQASVPYRIETVATGLEHPWSLAFLPDGGMLVTERAGRLRLIDAAGTLNPQPIANTPPVSEMSQSGLMEVAIDPEFASNRLVYFTHTYGTKQANNTQLSRARLEGMTLADVQPLFLAKPAKVGGSNNGGRFVFLPDNTLVLSIGDGFDLREQAQNPANHIGKTVRLNRDGSIPRDNPYVGRPGVAVEIFTMGHRNMQGLTYDATAKRLFANEHGPRGGDELNLLAAGGNYGWPMATQGLDYTGARVTPYTQMPGTQPPLLVWTPSVAPSGMAVYTGERFAAWQGDIFVSTLVEKSVRRVKMMAGVPTGEQEILFKELNARIRDVRDGPDGALYVLTDEQNGRVLRIVPQ
ncbi:PQQ-dependent sugar dehydrogenase [Schauerella aestuarii]|uniref:PQQ-dependent sugar dehydrogenase n=1 Tax=Schauerella aestuarii TaxID=2511204 RepID=UPI00192929D9|nr:PQQ-dependent sugar dehydrogenase [Achromobacter aestuarii]